MLPERISLGRPTVAHFLITLNLFLVAASLYGQQASGSVAPGLAPAPAVEAATYRLSQGDTVLIRFFFNPELNDETQIRPDGNVSLQLIGEIKLAGRTTAEVAEELERRYKSEVKMPRITVQVRTYAGQKIFVTGEVVHPGALSLVGGLDIVSAVAEAGGVRQTGKSKTVVLIRKGSDGKLLALKMSLNVPNQFSERLQPFDLVIVPPRAIVKVDRFVDEYIRQVIPGNLEGGFQYLYNQTTSAVSVIPF